MLINGKMKMILPIFLLIFFVLISSNVKAELSTNNILAAYQFTNANGTDSKGDYNLVTQGNPSINTSGIYRNGVNLDGDDYFNGTVFDKDDYNDGISFSCWVRSKTPENGINYMGMPEDAVYGLTYLKVNDAGNFVSTNWARGVQTPTSAHTSDCGNLKDGGWHIFVATHNSTNDTIYVDGVECASYTSYTLANTGTELKLFADQTSAGGIMGEADECYFWNVSLTAEEIVELNTSFYPFVPNTPPTMTTPTITPSPTQTTDDLTCNNGTYFDADGDPQVETFYRFRKDGKLIYNNTWFLTSGNTSPDDLISCEILVFDGEDNSSDWISSVNVTIGDNINPEIRNWTKNNPSFTNQILNVTVDCLDISSSINQVLYTIETPSAITSNQSMLATKNNEFEDSDFSIATVGTYNISFFYCQDTSGNWNKTKVDIEFTVSERPSAPSVGGGGGGGGITRPSESIIDFGVPIQTFFIVGENQEIDKRLLIRNVGNDSSKGIIEVTQNLSNVNFTAFICDIDLSNCDIEFDIAVNENKVLLLSGTIIDFNGFREGFVRLVESEDKVFELPIRLDTPPAVITNPARFIHKEIPVISLRNSIFLIVVLYASIIILFLYVIVTGGT